MLNKIFSKVLPIQFQSVRFSSITDGKLRSMVEVRVSRKLHKYLSNHLSQWSEYESSSVGFVDESTERMNSLLFRANAIHVYGFDKNIIILFWMLTAAISAENGYYRAFRNTCLFLRNFQKSCRNLSFVQISYIYVQSAQHYKSRSNFTSLLSQSFDFRLCEECGTLPLYSTLLSFKPVIAYIHWLKVRRWEKVLKRR